MARRNKNSPADDLIELLALLPWWACVALGVVAYFLLNAAARPVVTVVQPGQIGTAVTHAVWQGLAMVGQFLVPFLCFVAALMSFIGRRKRRDLVSGIASGKSADVLRDVTWKEFELLVGEAFRLQDYRVVEKGGSGPDGGVDLVLRKGREKFLVQCKQWKAFSVGVQVVRELYGVMAAEGAAGGFVVTSGRFTEDARAFASGRNVTLIDGSKLFGLIQQAKASLAKVSTPSQRRHDSSTNNPIRPPAPATSNPPPALVSAPSCPVCSATMVRRNARRGANAGSAFWGCPSYPACRGTRPAESA